MTTRDRKAVHVYLEPDQHDHWHYVAGKHGVSVSALVIAVTPRLESLFTDTTEAGKKLVVSARRVDTERRRRQY